MVSGMESLLALFAAPAVKSTIQGVSGVAAAVAQPFADVLSALAGGGEANDAGDDGEQDGPGALGERIAERLQELLEAAGATAGDYATLRYDADEGAVTVDHAGAAELEAAIEADHALLADLHAMAQQSGADEPLELLVQVA